MIKVASLPDLLATKLKVILQRIEAKDYQDIAAILRAGEELDHGLVAATAMFNPAFQSSEALKALTYFEGGDLETLSTSDRECLTRAAANVRHRPVVGAVIHSLS